MTVRSRDSHSGAPIAKPACRLASVLAPPLLRTSAMRNTTKRSFLTTGLLAAALMALPLAGCKKDEADVPEAQEKVQEAR
jgi:hypothetical protein